jgi:peptide-methionine (S)-S-oxide reductase
MTIQTAVLGGGCFWCLEAVFLEVRGVLEVESGYTGGRVADPTYEQVCEGTTGHAEVVKIRFDDERISFADLLEIFFVIHDPTTLNRQGHDVGTQYRSAIYWTDETQREAARTMIASLSKERVFGSDPIVTEVTPLGPYYPAEAYHQRYFERNPGQGYCRMVVAPKVAKFRQSLAARFGRGLQP